MGKRHAVPVLFSPKKFKFDEYVTLDNNNLRLSKDLVVNTIVTDINKKKWRIGKPIGKGSFGEVYTASNDIYNEVADDAEYVIKIEPHASGPLFTEINCLLRIGRTTEDSSPVSGVPGYVASGSHIFLNKKYRFMIIPRYRIDLSYLLNINKVSFRNILIIAVQVLDILEYIHSKGFAHSDIKAQNLMVGVDKNISNTNYVVNDKFNYARINNPTRKCRVENNVKEEHILSRSLRARIRVNYDETSNGDEESDDDLFSDYSEGDLFSDEEILYENNEIVDNRYAERIFLIDYGLASKFVDSRGMHRAFYVDERRAHDGTLEYTSRDAHFGAHSRRSDLECLGYNLLDWITGDLPWKEQNILLYPEIVHRMKICFMSNIRQMMNYCYNKKYPDFLRRYLEYVCSLDYTQDPDYDYCRSIFLTEFKRNGFDNMNLDFKNAEPGLDVYKCIAEKPSLINLSTCFSYLISNESVLKKFSPKNLRSKQLTQSYSPKKLRSKKKSFTWDEFLYQADHLLQTTLDELTCSDEVDSNLSSREDSVRYEGKPTYAIKLVIKSLKEAKSNKKTKSDERKSESFTEPDGLTYAMRLVLEKKNIRDNKENINKSKQTSKKSNIKGVTSTTNLKSKCIEDTYDIENDVQSFKLRSRRRKYK